MKFIFIGVAVLLVILVVLKLRAKKQERTPLVTGNKIPSITLNNQFGEPVNIQELVGKKNLIIYFYPKDNTPGCTKEACTFQDNLAVFSELDAQIIGISSDSEASHLQFSKKYQLDFTLLSDVDQKAREAFGINADFLGLIPGRVTFIIDKKGEIRGSFNAPGQIDQHVNEAKRVLKEING